VVGYVNFKELVYHMRVNPKDATLAGIIRPIHFVAPDDPASELLKAFVEQHVHMAIVRDCEGRTLGLVTLEDLVEEFVGELEDEFDRLPRMFHVLRGGTWMIGGGTPMSQVASELKLAVPDAAGSVSAWLLQRYGCMPKPGAQIWEGDAVFSVRRVRRGKIFEVAVSREDQSTS
jgi:putative hemolysin